MKILMMALLLTFKVFADDKVFQGESEASSVVISGNSNTETYTAKTKNTYNVTDLDLLTVFGKYLKATTAGTESNKAWEAGLRYERVFTKDLVSGFLQHKAEHDPYNGVFIQRDSTDVGGKYVFVKNDSITWFAELGYRYSKTYIATDLPTETAGFIRTYTEAGFKLSESTSTKIWVEQLSNLKKSGENQTNAEVSLSVAMNSIFSLKSAYLLNRNEALQSPLKKDTTTWTTALVAKY